MAISQPILSQNVSSVEVTGEKRSAISFQADFSVAATYEIDLTNYHQNAIFTEFRGLYVNNVTNPNWMTVTIAVSNQVITTPPYSCGYYRVLSPTGQYKATISSVGGASALCSIICLSFEVSNNVWIVTPSGLGTAVTIADGADVALGTRADAAVVNPAAVASLIALTKGILTGINSLDLSLPPVGQALMAASIPVAIASDQSPVQVVGNAASGAADSGNPVKAGGKYNAAKPVFVDGNRGDLQIDTRGSLRAYIGVPDSTSNLGISPTNLDGYAANQGAWALAQGLGVNAAGTHDRLRTIQGASAASIANSGLGVSASERAGALFNRITTAATTTVKNAPGILHRLVVSSPSAVTVTVFDNATPIALFTLLAATSPYVLDIGVQFGTSLIIITTAACDITAVYR